MVRLTKMRNLGKPQKLWLAGCGYAESIQPQVCTLSRELEAEALRRRVEDTTLRVNGLSVI